MRIMRCHRTRARAERPLSCSRWRCCLLLPPQDGTAVPTIAIYAGASDLYSCISTVDWSISIRGPAPLTSHTGPDGWWARPGTYLMMSSRPSPRRRRSPRQQAKPIRCAVAVPPSRARVAHPAFITPNAWSISQKPSSTDPATPPTALDSKHGAIDASGGS